MYLQDEIKTLQMIELFSEFNSEQLNLIAFTSKKLKFLPDDEIFHEGQTASGGYAIMHGSVNLVRREKFEDEHLGKYEAGSLLSELSLITPNRRRATAIANSEAILLSIPRSIMLKVITEYPHLAVDIKTKIQKNMAILVNDIKHVPDKLNRNRNSQ